MRACSERLRLLHQDPASAQLQNAATTTTTYDVRKIAVGTSDVVKKLRSSLEKVSEAGSGITATPPMLAGASHGEACQRWIL
jgi:hypothetical protein